MNALTAFAHPEALSAPSQRELLERLIAAAQAALPEADANGLHCSREGIALVNAAYDIWPVDDLYAEIGHATQNAWLEEGMPQADPFFEGAAA